MENDDYFVRAYSKNKLYTGKHIATKLWVGDYSTGSTFEEFAREAEGISRIGVLRADVDNLGQAIVSGHYPEQLLYPDSYPYSSSIIFDSSWKMENIHWKEKMVERKDRLQLYIPEEMMYLL